MKYLLLPLCILCFVIGLTTANVGAQTPKADDEQQKRLPNGKLWADEIAKADHQRNKADAEKLIELSTEIRDSLDRGDWYVVSLKDIQKLEKIESLAKDMKARLRRN